jgi:glycosyltransferase involved in cell wall biosynthesis
VDAAIFHLVRTSGMKPERIDIPSILEMCDALSANYAQTAREGALLSPWRIVSQIEASRLLEFERSETKRYDLVSLHTAKDAERIGLAADSLLVSTQGVDLSGLDYVAPHDRQGRSIALVGRVDFFPNKQSVLWFAKHVLPALPQDMTLKVIGDCSPKLKHRLEALSRVVVTGRVASIGEACADCFAAVAPMRVATGIQNKVLEYFAMGLPSVLSPSVASGLLKEAEGGYQVADVQDEAEWARLLMAVAERPASYCKQTEVARRYAIEMHSWDRIGEDYIARLRSLMVAGQSAALHD